MGGSSAPAAAPMQPCGTGSQPVTCPHGGIRAPWQPLLLLLPLLIAAVLFAHWPAISAQAISFDDQQYLTDNYVVQHPSWASARRFLSEVLEPSTVRGYYQPLAMISLMLDFAMADRPDNLVPFHSTSLGLHVANTCLIAILLYLLFGRPWPATLVALLFGVHPLTVEPIPWVGERKTLLAAFFALICLIFYVRYALALRREPGESGARPWVLYAASLFFYLPALMSKPTTTPLPMLLLLMDYWPLQRLIRPAASSRARSGPRVADSRAKLAWRVLFEKTPFFALAGLFAVITFISQARSASVHMPSQYSPLRIPMILAHNIVFYLRKIVWPAKLSSHYPFPDPMSLTHPAVLAGVIGTAILLTVLLWSWRWTPALLTGWLMFFFMQLPTMQIVGFSDVIASDKFTYLPAIGLLIVLAWWLTRAWGPASGAAAPGEVVDARRYRYRRAMLIAGALLLAGAETYQTRAYLSCFTDTEGLYRHMISLAPQSGTLYRGLGVALAQQKRYSEALPVLERARQLDPLAEPSLGLTLFQIGRKEEALEHLRRAVHIRPDEASILNLLAISLIDSGKTAEAEKVLLQAIRIKPDYLLAHMNYGRLLVDAGRLEEADREYQTAIRIYPEFAFAWIGLGESRRHAGRLDDAIRAFSLAIQYSPREPAAHAALAGVLEEQGRLQQAIEEYQLTLQFDPQHAGAKERLEVLMNRFRNRSGH